MHFLSIKRLSLIGLLLVSLGSVGCANMTTGERRVATGAGIGAVTGAVVTGRGSGAAVGAAVGAGTGYLYHRSKKKKKSRHY